MREFITKWRYLIVLALVIIVGWYFRHSLKGAIHEWALPEVEAPAEGTVRFAVIGDYGSGWLSETEVARMVHSWKPAFVATVGDNNYPKGAADTIDQNIGRQYARYIYPYQGRFGEGAQENRFFPVPGHVDWDSDGLNPYLEYFTLPGNERYYDRVSGSLHLFMLDTDEREPDGATESSAQGLWLKQALAESTATWKLVLAHHAPYTSHQVEDIVRMRWPFAAWGADAVLSGYYHVYERLNIDGIPYFVNGAGGTWISHFGAIDPHSQFRYAGDFGAMMVDAAERQITFRFVNRIGKIIDQHVLVKDARNSSVPAAGE